MNKVNSGAVGRIAATAIISMGLTVGAVSIASAASHSTHAPIHSGISALTTTSGTVTAFSSASVTVLETSGTSSTFTITSGTTIMAKHVTSTLQMGERVTVRALASAPTVATQITIEGMKTAAPVGSFAVQGHVTAASSTSVTIVSAKGVTSTYAISPTTKLLGGSRKTPLAVGQRVVVRALRSAPTSATRITIER